MAGFAVDFENREVILAGERIKVCYLFSGSAFEHFVGLGGCYYEAKVDVYAMGEKFSHNVWKHLRQAVPVREGVELEQSARKWPRLRKALINAEYPVAHISGGGTPMHYVDEVAVCDFSMSGAGYFILPKRRVRYFLDKYAPLDDRARDYQAKMVVRSGEVAAKLLPRLYEESITLAFIDRAMDYSRVHGVDAWKADGYLLKWEYGYPGEWSEFYHSRKGETMREFIQRTYLSLHCNVYQHVILELEGDNEAKCGVRIVMHYYGSSHFEFTFDGCSWYRDELLEKELRAQAAENMAAAKTPA